MSKEFNYIYNGKDNEGSEKALRVTLRPDGITMSIGYQEIEVTPDVIDDIAWLTETIRDDMDWKLKGADNVVDKTTKG